MFPEQPANAADDSAAIAAIEDMHNENDKSSSASSEKSSSSSESENEEEDKENHLNSDLDEFHQGIDRHANLANKPEDSENEQEVPNIDQSDVAAIQPALAVSSSSSSSSAPVPQPVPAFEAPVASGSHARRACWWHQRHFWGRCHEN